MKAGVNITAALCDAKSPNVVILGKATATFSGICELTGIQFQTNSDYVLEVTGTSTTTVNLFYCDLFGNNNNLIHCTNTNANLSVRYSTGDFGTTGLTYFVMTAGRLNFSFCILSNTPGSTTASTISGGSVNVVYCFFQIPITTTSTAAITFYQSINEGKAPNTTCLTLGGSGINEVELSDIRSGSASAISIGTSALVINSRIESSNTNAITGSGTLIHSAISFTGTSSTINTSTITQNILDVGQAKFFTPSGTSGTAVNNVMAVYEEGTFTPTLFGSSSAGTTTYSAQSGNYTKIGNVVTVWATVMITAATGTGNLNFGGLPFTIKNLAVGSFLISSASASWFPTAFYTTFSMLGITSTKTTAVLGYGPTTGASVNMSMANAAATFYWSMSYQV